MYIEKLHVGCFGCFRDCDFEFHNGLNWETHDNEFGKTTLRDFITQMFFGFANRSGKKHSYYDDNKKIELSGSITLVLDDGSHVCLSRSGKNAVWTNLDTGEEKATPEEETKRLTGLTANWYANIYAVTLNEISAVKNEDSDDFFNQFCGSRLTLNNRPLNKVEEALKKRADAAFNPRKGVNCTYADLDGKLTSLEQELEKIHLDKAQIPTLRQQQQDIRGQIADWEEKCRGIDGNLQRINLINGLLLQKKEYETLGKKLETLNFTPLPAQWQADYSAAKELYLNAEKKRQEAALPETEVQVMAKTAQVTDGTFTRYKNLNLQYVTLKEDLQSALTCLKQRQQKQLLPLAALLLLAAAGAVCVLLPGIWRWLAFLVAVIAALTAVLGRRSWKLHSLREEAALKRKHEEKLAEVQQMETEFRQEYCIAKDEQNVEMYLLKVLKIQEKLALYRKCEQEAAEQKLRFTRLQEEYKIYNDADAARRLAQEKEFAEVKAALETAKKRLEDKTGEIVPLPEELAWDCSVKAAQLRHEREELSAQINELQRQVGQLDSEIKRLDKLDDVYVHSLANAAREDLRRCARDYLTAAAAGILLKLAIRRYEADSQPEMVKLADKWFNKITNGRYSNLHKSLEQADNHNFTVLDNETSAVKPVNKFSRGTLEQLVISLRLAMIELWEKEHERMPVIMDDVAVNFDETRRQCWQQVMTEFTGEKRQTIIFNCR